MSAKHTPGPIAWVTSAEPSPNNLFHLYLQDAGGRKIAALWGGSTEKVANANLFSAAADLLEALEELLGATEEIGYVHYGPYRAAARAAIAKARGAA